MIAKNAGTSVATAYNHFPNNMVDVYGAIFNSAFQGIEKELVEYFKSVEASKLEVGYSDHTKPDNELNSIITSYILGARVIEKHFTFNKKLKGNDHYHSMDKNDLKKVIAYSTCSQLGYMCFAVGLSKYTVSFFHLGNHAFFKALLFLSAGCVIHAMADEQEMRRMGGLLSSLPVTYAMITLGSLALMGTPFLSGFYSKDAILEYAAVHYMVTGSFTFWLGVLAAACTSFYSWRLSYMTFLNNNNSFRQNVEHIHDAAPVVLCALSPLAIGAIWSGYFGFDAFSSHFS